ncbi:DUF6879 family protein [Streptosporangium sp. NPDC001681]|uniref:DUF6879 family protein n=1 Tax=Streptosporangium sp. NPDC001681 TaxID=3154395 RepID=UPI00331C2AB2
MSATKFLSLSDPRFNSLFVEFRHTAYRLETLQAYDVSYEQEAFDRFLVGGPRGRFSGIEDWVDMVRAGVEEGKRFHRVHVLMEPLSDYIRFECAWSYRYTVAAGEDVRVIPVDEHEWPEGLPRVDYWLFDSVRLLIMNYTPEGTFLSAELVEDPRRIVEANYWRDQAVGLSVPFLEYAAGYDDLMLGRRKCECSRPG